MGNLFALEKLSFFGCKNLKLSNLQMLKNLRELDVSKCPSIIEVQGLRDLVAMEKLYVKGYYSNVSYKFKLRDMCKFKNLQVLELDRCCLETLLSFDSLISFEKISVNLRCVDKLGF